MAAKKDEMSDKTIETLTSTTTPNVEVKITAPTTDPGPTKKYRLLRGTHRAVLTRNLTRTENGADVKYASGDVIRYDAGNPELSAMELTEQEARRFLVNPKGAPLAEPRISEVK